MIPDLKYDQIRPLIQTGDMLEIWSPGPIGWCIRRVTGQAVNHTAGVVRLWGRIAILEALERGPVPHILSDRLKELYRRGGHAYWIRLKPQYDCYRDEIAGHWFDSSACDKRYDYWAIFKQLVFGRLKKLDMRRLFCSEMMYAGYLKAKLPMIPQEYVPRPGEFGPTGCFCPPVRVALP